MSNSTSFWVIGLLIETGSEIILEALDADRQPTREAEYIKRFRTKQAAHQFWRYRPQDTYKWATGDHRPMLVHISY